MTEKLVNGLFVTNKWHKNYVTTQQNIHVLQETQMLQELQKVQDNESLDRHKEKVNGWLQEGNH